MADPQFIADFEVRCKERFERRFGPVMTEIMKDVVECGIAMTATSWQDGEVSVKKVDKKAK